MTPHTLTLDLSDPLAAIRAFLAALPSGYRKGMLFLDLLREVNQAVKVPPSQLEVGK